MLANISIHSRASHGRPPALPTFSSTKFAIFSCDAVSKALATSILTKWGQPPFPAGVNRPHLSDLHAFLALKGFLLASIMLCEVPESVSSPSSAFLQISSDGLFPSKLSGPMVLPIFSALPAGPLAPHSHLCCYCVVVFPLPLLGPPPPCPTPALGVGQPPPPFYL